VSDSILVRHLLLLQAFSYGYPWPEGAPPQNSLQGPNIWPETSLLSEAWRTGMLQVFTDMLAALHAVADAVALALGWDAQELAKLCKGGDTIALMRAFHYFSYDNNSSSSSSSGSSTTEAAAAETGDGANAEQQQQQQQQHREKVGSSPHTDWGLLTAILTDGAGLEVWDPAATAAEQHCASSNTAAAAEADDRTCSAADSDSKVCTGAASSTVTTTAGDDSVGSRICDGGWVDVPPRSDESALIINAGDFLQLLSGGAVHSPVHRVTTRGTERTSFVLFMYPGYEARLTDLGAHSESAQAAAAAAATAAAASDAVSSSKTARPSFEYNTLLNAGPVEAVAGMPFGDILEAKWKGVSRATS
jgi:isopenicillin N synthase-like dioxygenase